MHSEDKSMSSMQNKKKPLDAKSMEHNRSKIKYVNAHMILVQSRLSNGLHLISVF